MVAALFLNGCEKESTSFENNSETASDIALAFDVASLNSNIGIYKGVFTTEDSQTRGIIEMTIPGTTTFVAYYGQFPTATLTLSNGTILQATADSSISENETVSDVQFSGDGFSFKLSMNDDGSQVVFSDISLNGKASYALVKKHTNRAPITPITGVYQRTDTGQSHPNLEIGDEQSFNLTVNQMTGEISSSVMLSTVEFTGTGTQNNCNVNGVLTSCNTTGAFDVVGGTSITWDGTHLFNNEATGMNDCSDFDGAWTWVTNSYGTISGTFSSDVDSCTQTPSILAFEDFEDAAITYVANPMDNISNISNKDYFGIVSLASFDPADDITFDNVQGTQFYAAQDTDAAGSGDIDLITLTWSNFDITNLTNIDVFGYFAEDDDGNNEDWDSNSSVRFEYSFDNNIWVPFFAIEGSTIGFNTAPRIDTNLDGLGDGAEITDSFAQYGASFVTNGNTSVSVRIIIENISDGDEDIAIDNILIQGN